MAQLPVSGAYAKILYEFEDVYGYPIGGVINQDAAKGITKILGHGIRVDSWSKDNGLKPVIGLNNVEPSAIVDGPFNGNFSLSFAMIGDIAWMRAIMGEEVTVDSKTKRYTKNIAPPSMTFVVYINNDSVDAETGDMFLITGVVVSNVSISTSEDSPVTVQMDCVYKTEYKYDNITDIPVINPPADDVFNTAMVNAYFWNPNTDINGPSSFDSIECTIDRVNFSIKHTANLIRGIGTRVAKAKVHTNIEYEMSMDAVFQDPKKFLEKFYGCPETPSKYIAPYTQILIVIENFFRDSRHAKVSFGFRNAKIRTSGLPLAIENVIMENLGILPISCNIEVTRGCPATADVHVSPTTVYAGNELYVSGSNFYPGEAITINFSPAITLASGVDTSTISLDANCLGELQMPILLSTEIAGNIIEVSVTSGSSLLGAPKIFEVNVMSAGSFAPQLSVCRSLFSVDAGNTDVIVSGYNFSDVDGSAVVYLDKFEASTWTEVSAINPIATIVTGDIVNGAFSQTCTVPISEAGKYRIRVLRATKQAIYVIYAPVVSTASMDALYNTLTVALTDLPPFANVTMKYDNDSEVIYLGPSGADINGAVPSVGGTLMYTRNNATFPSGSTRTLTVTVANVNGGSFEFEKEVGNP